MLCILDPRSASITGLEAAALRTSASSPPSQCKQRKAGPVLPFLFPHTGVNAPLPCRRGSHHTGPGAFPLYQTDGLRLHTVQSGGFFVAQPGTTGYTSVPVSRSFFLFLCWFFLRLSERSLCMIKPPSATRAPASTRASGSLSGSESNAIEPPPPLSG